MAVTSFENKDKSAWPYFANHAGSKNTNYLVLCDGWQLWYEKKNLRNVWQQNEESCLFLIKGKEGGPKVSVYASCQLCNLIQDGIGYVSFIKPRLT